MKGSFRDNLKVPRWRRPFKLVQGKRPKIQNVPWEQGSLNDPPRRRNFAKEEVTKIVTEEPKFEMPGEDTKIPQLKPRYVGELGKNLTPSKRRIH
jgi:hypothetical protein